MLLLLLLNFCIYPLLNTLFAWMGRVYTLGDRGLSRALISFILHASHVVLHASYIFAARQASGKERDPFDSTEPIRLEPIGLEGSRSIQHGQSRRSGTQGKAYTELVSFCFSGCIYFLSPLVLARHLR